MIRCIAGDVEIFPNMFSITFVDLSDYLVKCSCKSDDGKKDIPLINKYTVAEIKEKLNSVKTWKFYITDTDDSQLMELLAFINGMQVRRVEKVDKEGLVYEEVTRTDFYGYNINNYDNYMIAAFLMYFNRFDTTKALIKHLYNVSKEIIDLQNRDRDEYFNHPTIKLLRNYRLPYYSVDVMTLFALNKAGVLIDKDTGERKAYPKSLKQTSINLQWHELLEFSLPPVNDEERVYYDKINSYKSLTNEELTMLISPFDRYIIPMYIEKMMYYNLNDVFIVCEIVRQKIDEVRLRYSISKSFNINVLSSARSNISDQLFEKFYADATGLHPSAFKKLTTIRTKISFKKVIFPHIAFKTKQLQDFLEEVKSVSITRTTKDDFCREIEFYGTKYTIAAGGIHSIDPPRLLKSGKDFSYVHHD